MLDFLINFLQKLKDKQDEKETLLQKGEAMEESNKKRIFLFILIIILLGVSFFAQFMIYSDIYEYNYNSDLWFYFKSGVSVFLKIILGIFVYKTFVGKKISMGKSLYLIVFPVLLASCFLSIDERLALLDTSVYVSLIFPVLYILNIVKLQKIKKFFYLYNIGFYLFLALNIVIITIGVNGINLFSPYTKILSEVLNLRPHGWEENFMMLGMILFGTTYGIYSLHSYFELENKRKNVIKGIGIFAISWLVIFIFGQIPSVMGSVYKNQILDAQNIITQGGDNYESYTKAKQQWFLERAFLHQIKKRGGLERNDVELFNKLFDSTAEEHFGEKIAEYTTNRSSFATNLSKNGEKAEVILELAEIENKILDENSTTFPILETTYRFHFENETTVNQEVIIHFETPSKNSVISDLKLGLNLELQGHVAPRGAALKVYEESLRKNIDPALIEKIGLSTYSLKVFPVTGKTNIKTRGKQLVQLKILTPVLNDTQELEYSPKFSFINLKFNEESGIISKFYHNNTLEKEDIVQKSEIEEYLTSSHSIDISDLNMYFNQSYCINKELSNYISENNITERELNLNKVSIFFDNSSSVGGNNTNALYKKISENIKNYGGKLQDVDMYSYNSRVEKILDSDDIRYWGNSNISSVVAYIEKNNFKNRRIIVVTDDDSFDTGIFENKNRNFVQLTSNQISVLKIGDSVKSYTSEFNNILSATNGNIYEVNTNEEIISILDKVFFDASGTTNMKSVECREEFDNDNGNKIWAGYIGNQLLSQIRGTSGWNSVAEKQTELSEKYNIVNQFNAFIALETEMQQRDLDRYKDQSDKYDTVYDNNVLVKTKIANNSINTANFELEESFGMPRTMGMNTLDGVRLEKKSIRSGDISFNSIDSSNSMKGVAMGMSMDEDYRYNRNNSVNFSFGGDTNISFLGLILLLIYGVQLYSIFSFVVKYRKSEK